MEEQIKAEFEKSGFSLDQEDEILQKCHTFCINYKLSPSYLVSNWEVYYLNRQLSGFMVENAHMGGFQLYLQSEQKEITMKEESHLHIYSSNDVGMLLNEDQDDAKESFLDTPISQSNRQYLESNYSESTPGTNEKPSSGKVLRLTSNRITPFSQRANKFILQFTFNDQGADNTTKEQEDENPEDDVIRRVRPSERCSFQIQSLQPKSGCRFMYDRIEDRFNSLENRIRRHTTAYATFGQHGEPTDATLASQKSVFAVGMVCSDGEGRLNEKSVLLQGSVEHSGGQRVRLDLQKLVRFSLFPGQVIGIEGHNPSGHCLIASKVIDSLPISPDACFPPAKKQVMDPEYQLDSSSNSLSVLSLIIAAGPFTTSDNLLFEPLAEIIAYASRKQPQLLILMGPFVDSEHPNIKNGTVDRSFDDIFDVEILRRLQDYMKYMGSSARVILMPSTRDANHDFVFPQPPFDINPLEEIKQQITCLANPSIFSANEITVGCSSVDILKQLSSEEISRVPADMPGERVGRLATHILNQLSFYPLFPPSLGVPLALSLAPEALEIDSIPQILILPSDLAPFVKVLSLGEREHAEETSRCICVNPGRLAKGIGGGTFVELNYNGNPDRTNASIVRI